jgi:hypothetical protein
VNVCVSVCPCLLSDGRAMIVRESREVWATLVCAPIDDSVCDGGCVMVGVCGGCVGVGRWLVVLGLGAMRWPRRFR